MEGDQVGVPGQGLDGVVEVRDGDQERGPRVEPVEWGDLPGGEEEDVGPDTAGRGRIGPERATVPTEPLPAILPVPAIVRPPAMGTARP